MFRIRKRELEISSPTNFEHRLHIGADDVVTTKRQIDETTNRQINKVKNPFFEFPNVQAKLFSKTEKESSQQKVKNDFNLSSNENTNEVNKLKIELRTWS